MRKIQQREPIHRRSSLSPTPIHSGEWSEDVGSDSENEETASSSYSWRHASMSSSAVTTPELPQKLDASGRIRTWGGESYRKESNFQRKVQQLPANKNDSSKVMVYAILCVVAVLGALSIRTFMSSDERMRCSFDDLQKRYPEQPDETWHSLSGGIESILTKRSAMPAVYLLIHQGSGQVASLVGQIVRKASTCLDASGKPAVMPNSDFASGKTISDYGHAIESYKAKIKNSRVILIENLNEIPAEAARALHTICDTYSPIASDVAIFLTLKTSGNSGNPMADAEHTLNTLWGNLRSNELDALITRVTDQVISLRN